MPSVNVHLEPVSIPDMDTIPIDGALFHIGRAEPFFSSLPPELNARLSRRHARIFVEQGEVYLTDLDSRNGTALNGKELKGGRPAALDDGDLVDFAGGLSFRVKLDKPSAVTQPDQESAESTPLQLVLKPANPDSGLEVIVVNQFPFLIARKDSIFERYSDTFAEQVKQISRRHAVIMLRDGRLTIEDLGSKNGTEVNGRALGEQSRQIGDGDTLAFGGDYFVYSACLPTTDKVMSKPETAITEEDHTGRDDADRLDEAHSIPSTEERTMFVDSPTSFLDIFCTTDDEEDPGHENGNKDGPGQLDGAIVNRAPGKLGQLRQQAKDVGKAFTGETKVKPLISRRTAIGIAVLAIIVLSYFLYPSDISRMKAMSEQGHFEQSAQLADQYLSEHPQDADIETLATKSLLKATLPDWLTYIRNNDYMAASDLLNSYQSEFPNITTGIEFLVLLEWVGDLQKFDFESGGMDGPVDIFSDEIEMKNLLEQWNRKPNRNRQILGQISAYFPGFKPLQKKTLSQIRQLRHSFSLYGNVIDELAAAATDGISSGNMEVLLAEIQDSGKNYPRLAGLDALKTDAQNYEAATSLLNEADLGTLIELQRGLDFETPVFKRNAEPVIAKQLPDRQTIIEYERALGAWRDGEAERAIAILNQLKKDTEWSSQINRQIERFGQVEGAFNALPASEDVPEYQDRLFEFRASLKPSEDSFYIESTRQEFGKYRDRLLDVLNTQYQAAKNQWDTYRQAGGINSVLRIEDPVSGNFRRQAARLGSGYADITTVVDNYQLLQIAPPADITTLDAEIRKEITRQRNWINDLGVVIGNELLQAKLELLPYPEEE